MAKINLAHYKTTYEGSYDGVCFELDIFDGEWHINWIDDEREFEAEDLPRIEQEIYQQYEKNL